MSKKIKLEDHLIPNDATVFAVKKKSGTKGKKLEAYVGYHIPNGNFEYEQIPFIEHPKNVVYRIHDHPKFKLKDCGIFKVVNVNRQKKYCNYCESHAVYQIWIADPRIIQPSAALTLCSACMEHLKYLLININK
ncbi:MAG: hypothetical protein PHF86_02620 [Candidatus Nanoarchaeia archaeon]|jgi:hypothetical protein|nr:hypothetical protein [Candidatus Nanoarchaeia archaeon]